MIFRNTHLSTLFTVWWMRSSCNPCAAFAAGSERKKKWPLSILWAPFSWKWPLRTNTQNSGTHTDTHTDTDTQCGNRSRLWPTKGEGWPVRAPGFHTSHWETINEKARGPRKEPPSLSLQGKMPRAIIATGSDWMAKADVPNWGLREVSAEGVSFGDAWREM